MYFEILTSYIKLFENNGQNGLACSSFTRLMNVFTGKQKSLE